VSAAEVDARLDALWADGVFRGQGTELARLAASSSRHPRADELRAFWDIAVLLEGEFGRLRPPGAYQVDPATPAAARALGHAASAWRAAVTADLVRAEIALERAEAALAEPADDPRLESAGAYVDLAAAEHHYFAGDHEAARARLKAASGRRDASPGARLAARGRLALIVGRRDPRLAVSALDAIARTARRLGQPVEVQHAQLGAAMMTIDARRPAEARRRLAELARTERPEALRYATLARLLLAVLADTDTGDAIRQVSEGIRLAATDGDTFAYIVMVGLATRLYVARGAPADALLTVTAGIQQLTAAGGDVLALPLIGEREALRNELGEEAFAAAVEQAHAMLA
jgi:hypothetical protein